MNVQHITVSSVNEAWNKANELFPTDYEQDTRATQNAGYPIYWSTCTGCAAWISDLGDRLEINLPGGDTVNVWIEEEPTPEPAEILGVKGTTTDGGKTVIITLKNGRTITAVKDPTHPKTGTQWAYSVNGQYWSTFTGARNYLQRITAEMLTGQRVIMHAPSVPALCGGSVDRARAGGCRCADQRRALCMDCAYAEQCKAERDGVHLIYAFD